MLTNDLLFMILINQPSLLLVMFCESTSSQLSLHALDHWKDRLHEGTQQRNSVGFSYAVHMNLRMCQSCFTPSFFWRDKAYHIIKEQGHNVRVAL